MISGHADVTRAGRRTGRETALALDYSVSVGRANCVMDVQVRIEPGTSKRYSLDIVLVLACGISRQIVVFHAKATIAGTLIFLGYWLVD